MKTHCILISLEILNFRILSGGFSGHTQRGEIGSDAILIEWSEQETWKVVDYNQPVNVLFNVKYDFFILLTMDL